MSKSAYTWVYDRNSGRWRHGGQWAKRPTRRQLRKDSQGRPIDARGKRVPESALPPQKKAKKPPKPKPTGILQYAPKRYAFDGKRWRVGGKFVAPPIAKDLSRDEKGVFYDSFGRPVPTKAVPDAPRYRPKPTRGKEVRRMHRGETVVEREFLSSRGQNKKSPDAAAEVLDEVIRQSAAKGPFDAEDIVIFDYGIKFVGERRLDETILSELQGHIPHKGSIKFVDTKVGTEVYIHLGKSPKLLGQVVESMEAGHSNIQRIYELLADYWDTVDWYVWAETDESLYE